MSVRREEVTKYGEIMRGERDSDINREIERIERDKEKDGMRKSNPTEWGEVK